MFPGLVLWRDQQCEDRFITLALPLMIETCRQELTRGPDVPSRVEILWKGDCLRDDILSHTQLIEENGWAILDTKESVTSYEFWTKFSMLFTMRWREGLVGHGIADAV